MTDAAVAIGNDANELSCVVIPASGNQLLLPNVCVAEIVPWRRIKVLEDGPAWCLGYMGWRGLTLPVVHYGGFDESADPMQTPRCLIVMNRARTSGGIEFYALVADSLPRMVQLVEEDLTTEGGNLGAADSMHVSFGTEIATIPDLAYVENQVAGLVNGLNVV
jgi:chemosensory pili system protein ChpC